MLANANEKLTRQQMLADWPAAFPKPDPATLWRWLDRAVKAGMVRQEGNGKRDGGIKYWLPEREEEWRRDPLYVLKESTPKIEDLLREFDQQWEARAAADIALEEEEAEKRRLRREARAAAKLAEKGPS